MITKLTKTQTMLIEHDEPIRLATLINIAERRGFGKPKYKIEDERGELSMEHMLEEAFTARAVRLEEFTMALVAILIKVPYEVHFMALPDECNRLLTGVDGLVKSYLGIRLEGTSEDGKIVLNGEYTHEITLG